MRGATMVLVGWLVVIATVSVCAQGRVVNHRQSRVQAPYQRVDHSANTTNEMKHSSSHNTSISHKRKRIVRKRSPWSSITNILLGTDDDYDSQYDSSESSEQSSQSGEHAAHHSHSRWRAMASSALAQVGLGMISKLWKQAKVSWWNASPPDRSSMINKRKLSTNRLPFRITTFIPLAEEDLVEEAVAGTEDKKKLVEAEGEAAVEEGIQGVEEGEPKVLTIEERINKLAGKQNPLHSLAELKREVENSGRRLSFIEYAAILEIVVLAVIAAGVFRTASLPVPVSVFGKA